MNLTAAQDFVNLITSPDLQGQLQFYLNSTTDPAGPPFIADASPTITATGLPGVATAGHSVTVTGTVTNAQPGFAAIDNKPVSVNEIVGGLPIPVGSGTTDSSGHYSVTFTPTSSGSYQVSTGQIQQIENGEPEPRVRRHPLAGGEQRHHDERAERRVAVLGEAVRGRLHGHRQARPRELLTRAAG